MIENYLELKNSVGVVEVSEELYKSISELDFFYHDDITFIHIDKYYAKVGNYRESIDLFCKIFKFTCYYSATSTTRVKGKIVKFVFCCINETTEEQLYAPTLSKLKRHAEKPYFPPKGFIINHQIV